MKKAVIVDCQTTGISGDKFLAALIDMGANIEKLNPLIKNILNNHSNCTKFDPKPEKITLSHFTCTRLNILLEEKIEALSKKEVDSLIEKDLTDLSLSMLAKQFIKSAFTIIFEAEASIHGKQIENVHLHEIASVDTYLDIIGSALLIDDLNLFANTTWIVLPIAVGSGEVKISHGIIKTPAPATLKILQDNHFIFKGMNIKSELTTPTGVSILAALKCMSKEVLPRIIVEKTGYGGGTKTFEEYPNILRLIKGNLLDEISQQGEIAALETNVDDVTGEVIGNFINKMSNLKGVRDISVLNTITKKNRPGYLIKLLVDPQESEPIKKIIFEELGTLGMRHYLCGRSILKREITKREIYIDQQKYIIRIKTAQLADGTIVNVKPEFEDVKEIANKIKKPFNHVLTIIKKQLN